MNVETNDFLDFGELKIWKMCVKEIFCMRLYRTWIIIPKNSPTSFRRGNLISAFASEKSSVLTIVKIFNKTKVATISFDIFFKTTIIK